MSEKKKVAITQDTTIIENYHCIPTEQDKQLADQRAHGVCSKQVFVVKRPSVTEETQKYNECVIRRNKSVLDSMKKLNASYVTARRLTQERRAQETPVRRF